MEDKKSSQLKFSDFHTDQSNKTVIYSSAKRKYQNLPLTLVQYSLTIDVDYSSVTPIEAVNETSELPPDSY